MEEAKKSCSCFSRQICLLEVGTNFLAAKAVTSHGTFVLGIFLYRLPFNLRGRWKANATVTMITTFHLF